MEIQRFFAYAENARALLRETLTAHPETLTQVFETTAQYHTIGQLIAHLIGAERRLTLGRLCGETPPPRYEEQAAETLEGLFADWDAIRSRTAAFVANADESTLAQVITMVLPALCGSVTLTLEEVVFHICHHQTWHLGQISMAWQCLNIDPPNFDYVLLRDMDTDGED